MGALPPTPLPAHVLSTLVVKNLTRRRLPIGGGIILSAGQTMTKQVPFVQIQEELVPRLNILVRDGYVSYSLLPGEPQDIAGTPLTLTSGVTGIVTVAAPPYFLDQAMVEAATDVGGWVMTKSGTLKNFFGNAGTAAGAGAGHAATYTVNKNRANTALKITFPASASIVAVSDTADVVPYIAGDVISIQEDTGASCNLHDVRLSIEA